MVVAHVTTKDTGSIPDIGSFTEHLEAVKYVENKEKVTGNRPIL